MFTAKVEEELNNDEDLKKKEKKKEYFLYIRERVRDCSAYETEIVTTGGGQPTVYKSRKKMLTNALVICVLWTVHFSLPLGHRFKPEPLDASLVFPPWNWRIYLIL